VEVVGAEVVPALVPVLDAPAHVQVVVDSCEFEITISY